MKKASRIKRLIANIIDIIVCGMCVSGIVFFTIPNLIEILRGNDINFANIIVFFDFIRWLVVSFIFIGSYYILVPVWLKGQTIGMKVMRIKIVKLNGDPVGFATMFTREIIGRILFDFTSAGITTIVSLLLVVRKNRLSLHDTLAETMVVEKMEE